MLGQVDAHFEGDYLNEQTILRRPRGRGLSDREIGKLGPALIFDHTERLPASSTIVVDDATGSATRHPASRRRDASRGLSGAGLPYDDAGRGARTAPPATSTVPGHSRCEYGVQQDYFAAVGDLGRAAAVQGPRGSHSSWCSGRGTPMGRSITRATASATGPRHQRADLASRRSAMPTRTWRRSSRPSGAGTGGHTDVILTSDHGFSTISKESATSVRGDPGLQGRPAASCRRASSPSTSHTTSGLSLFDPDARAPGCGADSLPEPGQRADRCGSGQARRGGRGKWRLRPRLSSGRRRALAARVVQALSPAGLRQRPVRTPRLGSFPATLPSPACPRRRRL